jgi:ATP-dependent DNA helicase RecG
MTSYKISKTARERLDVICKSNDGFAIAEADLKLRGPGDIAGTRQSGAFELK